MEVKDILRHRRFDTPVYQIWVPHQPKQKDQSKQKYMKLVRSKAAAVIEKPIISSDVEVEILYSTKVDKGVRADIDNVIKPTLDGLKGVAYADDSQVRSVTATLFDRTKDNVLSGRVEYLGPLFYSGDSHLLLISIYSDTCLAEHGGEETLGRRRLDEFLKNLSTRSL